MARIGKIFIAHIAAPILATAALCFIGGHAHARSDTSKAKNVQDPHFGEVLFDFYQQKYFSALTHLLAAEQLARVNHHTDDAELLRAGMYLSYGMHMQAAQIFQRLIDQGATLAITPEPQAGGPGGQPSGPVIASGKIVSI